MKYNGLTSSGSIYQAKCAANNIPVKFVKVKVGNGLLEETENPLNFTDIKSLKKEVGISEIAQVNEAVRLTVPLTNDGVTEGYYPREFGIYVEDDGVEVLYWYINDGQEASYLPPQSSAPVKIKNHFNIIATSLESLIVNWDGKEFWVDKEYLGKELAKKENIIDKKTGFNLEKTDSYELDDINKLVSAKALYNFNQKTKTDYEPKILTKNTGFNLNKTDNFNESDTNKLVTAKALSDAYSLILGNNFGGYIQTAGSKQKGKIYISTTSNSLFICTADTSIAYVDYNYFTGSSLADILRTTFSQAKTVLTPTQGFSVTYRQIRGQLASIIFQNLITANSSGVEYFLPFPINAIATATATSASTNNYVKLVASTENTFKLFCDTPVSDVQVQLMVYAKNALIDW
ncbi:hypothetical protein [Fusobacterium sp.]|uniref:hypothetical protein n=1 Tax=Fusobacterium sp. TaxID=68766 RepID=UPI0029013F86|nr:hypothetical protein [Fusobacterium sp.]MDU1911049.1 hypothetical protein [Fusobacterium sp.]